MKEIIPFKKDIIFKTKISEITDISLTHDYRIKEGVIEGDFTLAGEYKMTEASTMAEEFYFKIPFSISISDRMDPSTINLTIDDFEYTFNRDIMNFDVKLELDCEEINIGNEEIEIENNIDKFVSNDGQIDANIEIAKAIEDERHEKEDLSFKDFHGDDEEKMEIDEKIVEVSPTTNLETESSINNLTKNLIHVDDYSTYKVYIVRKDDTLESILTKYNISVDDIKEYNDISSITVGDKIVIPSIVNE